jgi:hypothetical protein
MYSVIGVLSHFRSKQSERNFKSPNLKSTNEKQDLITAKIY